jgi:hypothetical protein
VRVPRKAASRLERTRIAVIRNAFTLTDLPVVRCDFGQMVEARASSWTELRQRALNGSGGSDENEWRAGKPLAHRIVTEHGRQRLLRQ